MGKRLAPVAAVGEGRLAELIAGLGSDVFADREKATKELEKLGEAAGDALRQALAVNPPLEARRRLERLLKALDTEKANPSGARLRLLRGVEVLDRLNSAEARALLRKLAAGAPGALLTREASDALARGAGR